MPWTTPGTPRPTAAPPRGSTPTNSASESMNPEKIPMAFEPPPTQAQTTSGTRPSSASDCTRASWPITSWNVRTIQGYGWGPITDPKQ